MTASRTSRVLGASLHAELVRSHRTPSTAESLTGGALADLLSASPGASETYAGGVVCYATEAELKVLGVDALTVDTHAVVSNESAREMADGARSLFGTDYAVSTTGVAGPTEPRSGTRHVFGRPSWRWRSWWVSRGGGRSPVGSFPARVALAPQTEAPRPTTKGQRPW